MTLNEFKAVCKELELICEPRNGRDWYVYTQNYNKWIACYYHSYCKAMVYHSGECEKFFNDKDDFMEGLKQKLKKIKEETIEDRIKSLEKDFENDH